MTGMTNKRKYVMKSLLNKEKIHGRKKSKTVKTLLTTVNSILKKKSNKNKKMMKI